MTNMTTEKYQILQVTADNLKKENLFCLQSKKDSEGYQNKVKWFSERFQEGMKIYILKVLERNNKFATRGFIEFIPGEYTWRGIDAKGYLVIHCIWVVGQNKGKGYGSKLLEKGLQEAENYNGVAVLTNKKGRWLPKPKLFQKHGFVVTDSIYGSFELYVKKFKIDSPDPKFFPLRKTEKNLLGQGFTVFTSNQCPYNSGAVKFIESYAENHKIPIQVIPIKNYKVAQSNGYHPFGTYCILFNGNYLSYCFEDGKALDELLSLNKS